MSALTERIAAEHRWTLGEFLATNGVTYEWPSCACGLRLDDDDSPDHELHVATATEAAVREQIAAELATLSETTWDAYKNGFGIERADPYTEGQSDAYDTAATLAKGENGDTND